MKKALAVGFSGGIAALVLPCLAYADAYTFESTTTVETTGPGARQTSMSVHGWVDDTKAKIEVVAGEMMFLKMGNYLVTSDGGKTLYLVSPEEMTYTKLSIDELLNALGTIMNALGGLVKMEFTDVTSEKIAEGPGEAILGYATKRYEYQTAYTMNVRVLGFKNTSRNENHQELWCTDAIEAGGFSAWLRPDQFHTGNAAIDDLVEATYADLSCLPLRSRIAGKSTNEKGEETTSMTAVDVTALDEVSSIDAAMFEIPADYTEGTLLVPGLSAAPASDEDGDSAEDARDEPQPRLRLRDLLRR